MNAYPPPISILIPCYNAEQWIELAIESALKQVGCSCEVIVVDDGSTDSSREIIASFGEKIQYEFNTNQGGNAARNRLAQLAKGVWLQFLDADDYLEPQKISHQLSHAKECGCDCDVIYSPVTSEVWRNGNIIEKSNGTIDSDVTLSEQWIRWQVAQTGSVLWKRDALQKIGGWNEDFPCCQDNEVTLRAIQKGLRFHYCPHSEAVYRIWSEDTVCRKDPSKVIRYKTQLIEQMLTWLRDNNRRTDDVLRAAGQAFFEMSRTLAKFDLEAAHLYQRERAQAGPYLPVGPAAPWHYRLAHRLGGFRFAEQLAAASRK